MSNAKALYTAETSAAYERDGLNRAMPLIKKLVSAFESDTDALVVTRLNNTNVAAGGETTAWTNAAVRLYAIHVAMPSTTTASAFVQIFNTSTASVTLGTTRPDYQVKLGGTAASSKTVVFVPGNDDNAFSSALSYCVSTTAAGATGVNSTNTPIVTFFTNK